MPVKISTLTPVSPTDDDKLEIAQFQSGVWAAKGVTFSGLRSWLNAPELVSPPTSSSDTGTPGQVAFDSNYWYVCVTTDTWKRTALSSW